MADETRTKDQTRTQPQQMRDAGMPQGQAPAVQRPEQMTAVQRRDAENARKAKETRDVLLGAVEAKRMEIEAFLGTFGITYDLFLAGLLVFLSKQQRDQPEFFVDLNIPSFIEALTRVAMNGLLPDGKEAAIAAYKDKDKGGIRVAQVMFMRDGFVKVLWRTGMVRSINDQVVTEAEYANGRFDYEEGDQGFIQHKLDLMRKDTDPVVAAYCIIELVGGGVMREVVPKDELDKMAKMSRSPARESWKHQMHRKGAIRRIMGKMPREKGIVQLLQHDDDTYDHKALLAPAEEGAPSHRDIFGNKPIRRKKREPLEIDAARLEEGRGGSREIIKDEAEASENSPQGDAPVDEGHTDLHANEEPEFVLHALLTAKNGVQSFPSGQAEFWFGDIQQRMKALRDDPAVLAVFWEKNRGYIVDAGKNGFVDYAMKLMTLGHELGVEGGDRG